MSFLQVQGIGAGYGAKRVLTDISFSVEKGSLTGILGANGCGKTTLLRSVGAMLPHEGCCTLDGCKLEDLSERQRSRLCAYIPQHSGISMDISVLDVVLMGFNPRLKLLEYPNCAMKRTACEALERVGLADKTSENYFHLSEGQKQLCIFARTLVSGAKLYLLDEPESALDFQHRHRLLELLRQWLTEGERCALVSLHDPFLALNGCDRLLLLSDGKAVDAISPKADSIEKMEDALSILYGKISLQRCYTRSGQERLVMLKEDL